MLRDIFFHGYIALFEFVLVRYISRFTKFEVKIDYNENYEVL